MNHDVKELVAALEKGGNRLPVRVQIYEKLGGLVEMDDGRGLPAVPYCRALCGGMEAAAG